MDKGTLSGLLLAFAGILGGLVLDGGNVFQILQPTAALIVLGGTIGAVLVTYPLPVVKASFKRLSSVFREQTIDLEAVVREIVGYAHEARRHGIVALDASLPGIQDMFLRKALMLAVDGTEPKELRAIMELDMDQRAEQEEKLPLVFESAGGFSPTIGIIGAILGLIQVMQHLDNIDEVGKGIAVAFVATIYGVAAANVFFLPAGGKLKIKIREEQLAREMMLEGVLAILEGKNPRMVETKLRGYLTGSRAAGGLVTGEAR